MRPCQIAEAATVDVGTPAGAISRTFQVPGRGSRMCSDSAAAFSVVAWSTEPSKFWLWRGTSTPRGSK